MKYQTIEKREVCHTAEFVFEPDLADGINELVMSEVLHADVDFYGDEGTMYILEGDDVQGINDTVRLLTDEGYDVSYHHYDYEEDGDFIALFQFIIRKD